MNNEQLRGMAKSALENWDFDSETDPNGAIKRGLDFLAAAGDYDQEIIDARIKSNDDWDGLEDWAKYLGSSQHGGKRERAGRPTLSVEPTVRINAKVPQSVKDRIKWLGDGNISLGVRRAIDATELPQCPACGSTDLSDP